LDPVSPVDYVHQLQKRISAGSRTIDRYQELVADRKLDGIAQTRFGGFFLLLKKAF
jgi:hypothetical protein